MNISHPMRRQTDAISPINERMHDDARLLLTDIAVADRLGLEVISVDINPTGRNVFVAWGQACAALDGKQVGIHTGATQRVCRRRRGGAERAPGGAGERDRGRQQRRREGDGEDGKGA